MLRANYISSLDIAPSTGLPSLFSATAFTVYSSSQRYVYMYTRYTQYSVRLYINLVFFIFLQSLLSLYNKRTVICARTLIIYFIFKTTYHKKNLLCGCDVWFPSQPVKLIFGLKPLNGDISFISSH